MEASAAVIAWITFTFLLAGMVKGVIGMGLPLIGLGLLTTVTGLHPAMALMLAPAFVTNVWQAFAGPHTREVAARIWPFLLAATASIWIGALALTRINVHGLSALLGFLLAAYGALGLLHPSLKIDPPHRRWSGVAAGLINGVLAGMTGSFSIPGVPWLQAIGLTRDELIQAMGMLFTLSTMALGISLGTEGLLSAREAMASAGAVIPALAGMALGQTIRHRLSERQFRLVFFISLIALGAYIMLRAALG